MLLVRDEKGARTQSDGNGDSSVGDQPPAYDAISLHQSSHFNANQRASSSSSPRQNGRRASESFDPTEYTLCAKSKSSSPQSSAGPSSKPFDPAEYSLYAKSKPLQTEKALPSPPKSPADDISIPVTSKNPSAVVPQKTGKRKNSSWLSLFPFVSSSSSKRVRQSVIATISDLVTSSHPPNFEHRDAHEVLASVAESCTEHKLNLSSILQEAFIADHTPMYWAVLNYREELLAALLLYAKPLSVETVSEIRRACVASANQTLFQALRVRRPPFHRTDGIQLPNLRTASDNLLLGSRPADDIYIQQSSDGAFLAHFEISVWQKRMRVLGFVNIEFIASERIWSVTFFSTHPPPQTSGKSKKKSGGAWHVMVSLLEASPPTFFDSQLVIDVPPRARTQVATTSKLRETRSTTFPHPREGQPRDRSSSYAGRALQRTSKGDNSPSPRAADYNHARTSSSTSPLPPLHPLREGGSAASSLLPNSAKSVTIRLTAGTRKLGRRVGKGESPSSAALEIPTTTKPDTWSDKGVNYTSAAVSPLGEENQTQLNYDNSRYLLPDGTMRGRLEVRLVKCEPSKSDCIIC